jgi:hypothetical protein
LQQSLFCAQFSPSARQHVPFVQLPEKQQSLIVEQAPPAFLQQTPLGQMSPVAAQQSPSEPHDLRWLVQQVPLTQLPPQQSASTEQVEPFARQHVWLVWSQWPLQQSWFTLHCWPAGKQQAPFSPQVRFESWQQSRSTEQSCPAPAQQRPETASQWPPQQSESAEQKLFALRQHVPNVPQVTPD